MPQISRCDAISVTHNTALITWAANGYLKPRLRYRSAGSEQVLSLADPACLGRFHLSGLEPSSTYSYWLDGDDDCLFAGAFASLPAPTGAPLWRFAIVADPHYSTSPEDPKGRLSTESDSLLRETVARATTLGIELLIIAGDLTEHGLPEELDGCLSILSEFSGKVLTILGNHDLKAIGHNNGHVPISSAWIKGPMMIGGTGPDSECLAIGWRDFSIIGLDSSRGALGAQQQDALAQHLRRAGREVILISHRSVFPQPGLIDGSGVVEDWRSLEPLLQDEGRLTVAYVGHKHVARHLHTGSLWQTHVPQLIEYPCAFTVVEVYADRLRHILQPIASEALVEFSRLGCLATGKPTYQDAYRRGELSDRCFDIPRNASTIVRVDE